MKEFLVQEDPLLTPKKHDRVISTSVELNPNAICQDSKCPFMVESASAETQAYDHAQDTGHSVTVDHVRRQVVMAP